MARATGKSDRVRIAGHVGGDDTGELHGERGRVMPVQGGQYHNSKNGERTVSVQLDDGRIVGVPERALERG